MGIDSTKIEIVPNGIRDKEITSHLEDFSNKKSDIVIGYFGAIVPYEGLDILVDSAQKLNRRLGNSKMRYLVVGDGTDKSRSRFSACIDSCSVFSANTRASGNNGYTRTNFTEVIMVK